jgi:hypothetical protein
MVFSLEHDIKVTKSHQNLLPTQSVIVVHSVYSNDEKTESFLTIEIKIQIPIHVNCGNVLWVALSISLGSFITREISCIFLFLDTFNHLLLKFLSFVWFLSLLFFI